MLQYGQTIFMGIFPFLFIYFLGSLHNSENYNDMAITQKPISVRINETLLARLDVYIKRIEGKRNACINAAIDEWLNNRGA